MPKAKILRGDCRAVMKTLAPNSVDAIVCDPPYELSSDGKASPNRVAAKLLFPQKADIPSAFGSECHLSFLALKIARLNVIGRVPRPSSAVKVAAVALDEKATRGQAKIKHKGKSSIGVPYRDAGLDNEPETAEYLGCFAFELGDPIAAHQALDRTGCAFASGGIGIGFRIPAASLGTLFSCGHAVDHGNEIIGPLHDALASFVGALGATENEAVARFDLSGRLNDRLTTSAALKLLAVAHLSDAKLIRASAGAGRLPSKLKTRRVRVVDPSTNRALSFDLLTHAQSIASTGFMGRAWDGSKIAYDVDMWAEALRVLKPGGHLLAFGGTRTYHRMVCAIEDAGLEIRDCIFWAHGQGFPKSHNIGGGRGTALKPAVEPIVLARKPLIGSVADNVLRHGTGALNIDASRVGTEITTTVRNGNSGGNGAYGRDERVFTRENPPGRWPSHLLTDGSAEVTAAFPVTSASRGGTINCAPSESIGTFQTKRRTTTRAGADNGGSAARFFQACPPDSRIAYVPKASRADRDAGLGDMPEVAKAATWGDLGPVEGNPRKVNTGHVQKQRNVHPTVKPTSLMRYLCRLVTPPSGTVLDCFAGSGSTGRGAVLEGFDFIGIEQSAEFAAIARKRIAAAQREAPKPAAPSARARKRTTIPTRLAA